MSIAGTVVILNGPPHAGKTSIINKVQSVADKPYYAVGIDQLFNIVEPVESAKKHHLSKTVDRLYIRALHGVFSGLARSGCDLLVDHTILDRGWLDECKTFLDDLDVIWVEVKCSEEILVKREKEFGQQPEGPAQELNSEMYTDLDYDYSLDGGSNSVEDNANKLLDYLENRPMKGQPRARWVPRLMPFPNESPGHIVILAGPGSAGKSTLCRTIQELAEEPFIQFGVDTIIEGMAKRYMDTPLDPESMKHFKHPPDGRLGLYYMPPGPNADNPTRYMRQQLGPVARKFMGGQLCAVASMSQIGINVVSDQIFVYKDIYDEAAILFKDHPVLWVSVIADISILEKHERERGDRPPGHSLAHLMQMYRDIPFDLEIDSGKLTPDNEARLILNKLKGLI